MSGYVLDGIKTAMKQRPEDDTVVVCQCPCGWSALWRDYAPEEYGTCLRAALRFHFAHCEQAKVRP